MSTQLSGLLRIKDLKRWATMIWFRMGASNGCTRDEEEKGNEPAGIIVHKLSAEDERLVIEDGEYQIRIAATVVKMK